MQMKQFVIIILLALIASSPISAQNFNGTFVSEETGIRLHLDLDNESITIPGMSFLGETHGYLDGKTNNDVYGVWMLIRHTIEDGKAKLRFTNDIGSDSQDIVLSQINDSTFQYTALGTNTIRKVEGKKLVKTPSSVVLKKKTENTDD